ncbi:hypothetical protein [Colwellia sp. 12G3]|uniref:hypothetical protein n=1 Tax=Colwellia sp. 12G3 TaxID=2058299 RepID=UPI000C33C5DE|nr:hypothetical protein [Colwellia sp. 12G3]PKI16024.1 hypothetical protein CXF71_10225 [Colwellia sp. 12G3]
MKFLSVVILSLFLVACSSTEVRLYTRYLSDTDIKKISSKLDEANFTVITNTLSFPETIDQSTLLYSPFINGEKTLDILINSLSDIGWFIPNVEALVSGNHWYSKDSVGLFLLPEGVKQKDKVASQDLANDYESLHCDTVVNLLLNKDNSYQLSFANKTNDRTDHLKGSWKIRSYPYIELTSFNERWWFYFEIEQKIQSDKVSEINIIELKPVDSYSFFPNCSFVNGVRI